MVIERLPNLDITVVPSQCGSRVHAGKQPRLLATQHKAAESPGLPGQETRLNLASPGDGSCTTVDSLIASKLPPAVSVLNSMKGHSVCQYEGTRV